jgi:hypothetical protein
MKIVGKRTRKGARVPENKEKQRAGHQGKATRRTSGKSNALDFREKHCVKHQGKAMLEK